MPVRRPSPARPPLVVLAVVALLLALVLPLLVWSLPLLGGASVAGAAVEHGNGFSGVVAGFRSWYGSYRLGDVGEVWCVDHGIPAPDVALGYEPTSLDDHAADTRRAVAWAVGRHGPGADRVTAAALMLVLHDLMGAVYPTGPLRVEALGAGDLAGFEGEEEEVLSRARVIKADAVARAQLVGPLALEVSTVGDVAGRPGELQARAVDAAGSPMAGVVVHPAVTGAELLGDVDAVTDIEGRATWTYRVGEGTDRFDLSATVPGAELLALRPTAGVAQRVARPAAATLRGSASFETRVPRRFSITKRGDLQDRLPVTGARFTVDGHEVVVGPDGTTPPVELLPGTYEVREVAPPPGYDVGGPWTITIADTDVVLDVLDAATRGRLRIDKVDARTGVAVAGARFAVAADRDADPATFETAIDDPSVPLLPGRYEVREVGAPPGYRLAATPVVVEVRGGEEAVARIEDVPLVSVTFEKRPALAGATFAVRGGRDGPGGRAPELGRCTTDTSGRCSLAGDAVEGGIEVCWDEVASPDGWALAEGGCVTTGGAGSVTTIGVEERPLPPPPAPVVPATTTTTTTPAPEVESTSAPPPSPLPPAPPATVAAAPPAPAPELPRTGLPDVERWVGAGLLLVGGGLVLAATAGASSSGRPGRRRPRRRPTSAAAGRCRP